MSRSEPVGIVFDLDDTLYLERDYAFSGFEVIGEWLLRELGVHGFAEEARQAFEASTIRVFDRTLAALGVAVTGPMIERLVTLYRSHRPTISLVPDARDFLERWPAERPLAILTDGFRKSQRNKISALGLNTGRFSQIVCTDEWGRDYWKPHRRGFEVIANALELPPAAMVYVADNPAKDFIAPRALGWGTVRVARPEGVHLGNLVAAGGHPDATIQSLDELEYALMVGSGAHAA